MNWDKWGELSPYPILWMQLIQQIFVSSSDSALLDAVLQHGPYFLVHILFFQWTRYVYHIKYFHIESTPRCLNKPLLCSCPSAGVTAPLPGEVFTQSFKPAGYMIACSINWTGLFVLGMLFPIIVVSTVFNLTEKTESGVIGQMFLWLNASLSLCWLTVSSPGESGALLLPHLPGLLPHLWALCVVQCPWDQGPHGTGDSWWVW